ncbi:alpha/beta hydrolase [Streptomyces millisiae]|uniref:Alpha/beta hydrolase n=1 Tax=Streptomyces millisiae TaxID=3075542 RepID=A0ABU2LMF9_9ACTN|nr:alpha/beta hydrolase [Streptomyces sp. DSM 44918]MDT0318438.1 alpha/beta hydrolase [Streptomyces sp. DSM 44918]
MYRELLTQDFYPLGTAVSAWRRLAEACQEAHDGSLARASRPLIDAGWAGQSADTGLHAMAVTQSILTTASRYALLLAAVLDEARARMQAAQQRLRNAVADAEDAGHRVSEDGTVLARPHDPSPEDLAEPDRLLRESIEVAGHQARIDEAIEQAVEASALAGRALRELDPFTLDKEYGAQIADQAAARLAETHGIGIPADDIPTDRPPAEAARWWSGLTDPERDLLLASYPTQLGALDGLPAETRDQANRAALDAQLNDYRAREHELGHHDRFIYDGLTRLQETLDSRANAPAEQRLYLLGFGTQDDGRAIVAQGNPDTAAHTAVLVPGTTTDIGSMQGQIDRIGLMQEAALRQRRGDVAVISWLGYDAPEISDSVITRGRANEGADELRNFTAGLRAAHEGSDSHLTVVGHSYGSTTVGAADAGRDGLGADDVIVLGSPGLTVGHAEDLHISPERLWVGAADDDPISRYASGLTLGAAPQDDQFGAQRMYVDTSGHSGYWRQDSESLRNIGRVIAGETPSTGTVEQ